MELPPPPGGLLLSFLLLHFVLRRERASCAHGFASERPEAEGEEGAEAKEGAEAEEEACAWRAACSSWCFWRSSSLSSVVSDAVPPRGIP